MKLFRYDQIGGRKYLKSNILFKFPIDDHRIYRDKRNAMKVASQELRVINHLVNETSLNRLFVLPCLALITKCGLRMYASSLLPLVKIVFFVAFVFFFQSSSQILFLNHLESKRIIEIWM